MMTGSSDVYDLSEVAWLRPCAQFCLREWLVRLGHETLLHFLSCWHLIGLKACVPNLING